MHRQKPDKITRGACACNDDKSGLSKKLHAKAAAEKQQSITLVNQSFDEQKIVVLRSDAPDKPRSKTSPTIHLGVDAIFVNTSAFISTNRGRTA
jgi:hypothetical protein